MNLHSVNGWWLAALLGLSATAGSADTPALKEVFKDHFLVGTAINRSIATGAGFRRTAEQVARDIALVKHHFNHVVAENDMKWALIHPRPGPDGYDFGPADAFVDFGLRHGMDLAGHTLVWHSQTPNWVFAGTNPPPAGVTNAPPGTLANANAPGTNRPAAGRPGRGFGGSFGRYTGPRASREELLERMREHIHTVVGRYRGKIRVWDVVNEALADGPGTNLLRNSLWLQIIGPDYIARAFEYAHEADPNAILRYNDYGLENPDKRRKLITLIRALQEQKVPVHAIGSQAHLNVSITFETMDQTLTELATLGLPIHITELDVNSAVGGQRGFGAEIADNTATTQGGLVSEADRRQAEAYAGIFRAFLKHSRHLEMVTFWGANDANSWRAQGRPLLFDGNCEPKPSFHAVIAEAQQAAVQRAPTGSNRVTTLREAAHGLFLMGVGVNDRIPSRPQDWPLLLSQFNSVTPENCLKPDPVQRVEGQFRFDLADAFVEFATANRQQVVGHCLVWAKDDRTPGWFYRDGTNTARAEVLLARMKTHIDTVVGRYRGRIAAWDVVNEALDDGDGYLRDSGWSRACGEEFIVKAFEYAHAADPHALLIYNDYNNELPAKREKLLRLVRGLLERKVPIHAVGLQGHYEIDRVPFEEIEHTLWAMRELGLKVVISELDIDVIPRGRWWADGGRYRDELSRLDPYREQCPPEVLRRQAEQYGQLFRLFRKYSDVIARVSFWNLHDGQSWLNDFPWKRVNHPLLFDRAGAPKPAFDAVLSALQETPPAQQP